jgi:hypothetical protein
MNPKLIDPTEVKTKLADLQGRILALRGFL